MPLHDDQTIADDAILYRVLPHPNWVKVDAGVTRPSSIAFFECRQEVSFFVDGPGILSELRRIFPGAPIAKVPAAILREKGLAIERRPGECGDDFNGDPASHVVVGPAEQIQPNLYEKRARSIAKHPDVGIVPEEPEG